LIAIGIGVVHSSTVTAFDHHVTTSVVAHRTPALNAAMKAVTWLGSWVALVTTAVLIVVLAIRRRVAGIGVVLAVVAWGGEAGAVALAKRVVQRPRPPMDIWLKTAHGWSWPSGHTATAVLVFAVLALLVTRLFPSRKMMAASWVAAGIAVAAVGFSRIELGVHWTTDVLASLVFVSAWLLCVIALFGPDLQGAREPG
jgi:undecaprenyl-diphosphatase